MKVLVFIIILTSSLLCLTGPGIRDIQFGHITINDGLSQNTVYCIFQDKKGFMWFGTEKGLNKYDGHSFKIYTHSPSDPESLSYNMVLSIYEFPDEPGILWVGTWGGGLNRFDTTNENFTHFKKDENKYNSISDNTIRVLYKDSNNYLWIGTDSGINRFEKNTSEFKNFQILTTNKSVSEGNRVLSIIELNNGTILAGTDGEGIYYYDKDKDGFSPFIPSGIPDSFLRSKVRSMIKDRSGDLWAGTYGSGIFRIDNKGKFKNKYDSKMKSSGLKNDFIRYIVQDHYGYLWFATHGGGLIRFDPDKRSMHSFYYSEKDPGSISNNIVLSVLEDKEGVL
ncbi:MAG: histidine kinase, partial [Candidatus Aminicenantes bacterium]|nr:histidine kinase [Candidatus Aminicenantes bacterium]